MCDRMHGFCIVFQGATYPGLFAETFYIEAWCCVDCVIEKNIA